MTSTHPRRARRLLTAAALVPASLALAVGVPATAQAHSLDSTTLSLHVDDDSASATLTVAVETLGEALGEDLASQPTDAWGAEVVDYLADNLAVTGSTGATWAESWSGLTRTTVEGIDSVQVSVALDPGDGEGTGSTLALAYDAVIEAVTDHEVVVVLTDAVGEVSTAGVLTADAPVLDVATGTAGTATGAGDAARGVLDMVGLGFHHVLEGADHLRFLWTLLLTAPLVVAGHRWQVRREPCSTRRAVHDVLTVVTSFTVGHSLTLIASSLGWVSLPTTLVEVLVAASVGVAALHALRPLVRHGEAWIAAGFGLVHGLAFAGILRDLGVDGASSVPSLLAFNVGVELAQLAATALLAPSLLLLARTRWYAAVRVIGAGTALLAAAVWVLDRLGVVPSPVAGIEAALVAHPFLVAGALALVALLAAATGGLPQTCASRTGPRAATTVR